MSGRTLRDFDRIQFDEALPLVRHIVLMKDRYCRAFGKAGSTIDAHLGVDVNHGFVREMLSVVDEATSPDALQFILTATLRKSPADRTTKITDIMTVLDSALDRTS